MNLKLVVYDGDLTEFLVNADTDEEAIEIAIKANEALDEVDEDALETIRDPSVYACGDVDWDLLKEMFDRGDITGVFENTVVFGF